MNRPGRHSKCPEGDACNGPRCRAHTGKTARKQNWKRPKPNKHEASRVLPSTGGKKR